MDKVWGFLDVSNYDNYAMDDKLTLLFVFEKRNIKRGKFDNSVRKLYALIEIRQAKTWIFPL